MFYFLTYLILLLAVWVYMVFSTDTEFDIKQNVTMSLLLFVIIHVILIILYTPG
jgi:hypothetical protein